MALGCMALAALVYSQAVKAFCYDALCHKAKLFASLKNSFDTLRHVAYTAKKK
jgi:hypothetical protein